MSISKYENLGVSATKSGVHAALEASGIKNSNGLFCEVFPDMAGDPNFVSFLHADGAGTKAIIAYLIYKTIGDKNIFAGLAQDALVMNLDDVFCLGVPDSLLLSNTISRNARLIRDDIIAVIITAYKQLVEQLTLLSINIQLGGGETEDCGDLVKTLALNATIAGRIQANKLINPNNIVPGDIIVGLSSIGKSIYENTANSGIGSNGFTLARHSLLCKKHLELFPEICDDGIKDKEVYTGPYFIKDIPAGFDMTIGEALSSPTRTYAPLLAAIYGELGSDVHGVIHNTGGGQTKVLRFGCGNLYIKDNLFSIPPIFAAIQRHGNVTWEEMYQVFNMGNRMEVYVPARCLDAIIGIANIFQIEAKQIGHVVKNPASSTKNAINIQSPHGHFKYSI